MTSTLILITFRAESGDRHIPFKLLREARYGETGKVKNIQRFVIEFELKLRPFVDKIEEIEEIRIFLRDGHVHLLEIRDPESENVDGVIWKHELYKRGDYLPGDLTAKEYRLYERRKKRMMRAAKK